MLKLECTEESTRELVVKADSWAPPWEPWRRKVLGAAQEPALSIKSPGDSAAVILRPLWGICPRRAHQVKKDCPKHWWVQ